MRVRTPKTAYFGLAKLRRLWTERDRKKREQPSKPAWFCVICGQPFFFCESWGWQGHQHLPDRCVSGYEGPAPSRMFWEIHRDHGEQTARRIKRSQRSREKWKRRDRQDQLGLSFINEELE